LKRGNKSEAIQGVSDSLLNEVAIAGSPDESKGEIEQFKEAGADFPILIFPPKASREIERKR